jgi:LacI family transcriptional regulator
MLPLPDARHARHGAVSVGLPPESRMVRLAVMIHLLGELHHDWYARGVIAGIDDAAGEAGVTIELLGHRDGDFKAVAQRLMQTRPDLLCLVAPSPARLMIINEARRLDIPCIGTGTFLTTLGIPTVHEDNAQGTQLAIDHLLAHGHERIGFVQMPYLIPWVFQRREGYLAAMQRAGLSADESLVCWLNQADPENDSETLLRFIERQKPTALLLGSHVAARPLGAVVRGGRIRVPRDLSLITFDQNPIATDWLGGVRPTCIALPVQQMGHQLARTAREIVQRQEVAATVVQPCELIGGETVKPM